MKYIRTEKGPWGELYHYDETGGLVGESRPGLLSGTMHHYSYGDGYIGSSYPGVLSDVITDTGEFGFSSYRGAFVTNHYSEDGLMAQSYEDDFGFDTYF